MTPQAEFKSDLLRTLQARGYLHQITHPEELDTAARAGIVTGYIGFDATAASLHVGSLIQIMMLRRILQLLPDLFFITALLKRHAVGCQSAGKRCCFRCIV